MRAGHVTASYDLVLLEQYVGEFLSGRILASPRDLPAFRLPVPTSTTPHYVSIPSSSITVVIHIAPK